MVMCANVLHTYSRIWKLIHIQLNDDVFYKPKWYSEKEYKKMYAIFHEPQNDMVTGENWLLVSYGELASK